MYRILTDGKLLCDSRLDELAVINPIVELEANAAGSFVFTIPPDHPFYDVIQRRQTRIQVFLDSDRKPIFDGFCVSEYIDMFKQRRIECEGFLSYLNDTVLRPRHYKDVQVGSLLSSWLNKHNEQTSNGQIVLGDVTVNQEVECYTNMTQTITAIKDNITDPFGGYMIGETDDWGDRKLHYYAEARKKANQKVELGVNLLDYNSNIDDIDIATIIIPLGANQDEGTVVKGIQTRVTIESVNDDKDYLTSSAAMYYGEITRTVVFDTIESPSNLKMLASLYMQNMQFDNVTIEAKAIDMSKVSEAEERWELLDSVRVVSAKHGMDKDFVLTKITYNLNNPENDTFLFGKTESTSLSVRSSKSTRKLERFMSQVPNSSDMVRQIYKATNLITGASGGHVLLNTDEDGEPFEILVMDTADIQTATKVWRWNQNGLGYSSTGYAGPYGLAMTMDGSIVADFIKAGKISAIEIDNGKFKVTKAGDMTASSATINGDITFDNLLKLKSNTFDISYPVIREQNNQTPQYVQEHMAGEKFDSIGLRGPGDTNAIKVFSRYVQMSGGIPEYTGFGIDFNLPIFGNHAYIRNLHDQDGRDYQKKLKYTVEAISIPSTAGNTDGSVSISGFSNLLAIFPMGSAPGTSWNTSLHIKSWSNTTVNFRTIGSNTQKYTLYIGVLRLEDAGIS